MTQDKHQQTDGSRIDTTTRRGALAALGGAGLLAALGGGAQANVGGGDDADELSHLLSRFYEGPEDELPEAGVEGRRFFVTDSGGQYEQWTLLRDQGDAWDPVDLTLGALGSDSLDTEVADITGELKDIKAVVDPSWSGGEISDLSTDIGQSGGGTILFKSGEYVLDGSINPWAGNVDLVGVDRESVVIKPKEEGTGQIIRINGDNVSVRNMTLDGTIDVLERYGIRTDTCENVTIRNVKAVNFEDDCIAIEDGTEQFWVLNCETGGDVGSFGASYGIEVEDGAQNGIVAFNQCYNRDGGIFVKSHNFDEGGDTLGIFVFGNHIHDGNRGINIQDEGGDVDMLRSIVAYNFIHDVGSEGIHARNLQNVNISHNTVVGAGDVGIILFGDSHGCSVAENTVYLCDQSGIRVENAGNNQINGNIAHSNGQGTGDRHGISIAAGAFDNQIHDNMTFSVDGRQVRGIRVFSDAGAGNTVKDNHVADNAGSSKIQIGVPREDIVVKGNEGFRTENYGTVVEDGNGSFFSWEHGLDMAPPKHGVTVVPASEDAASEILFVGNVTDSEIQISHPSSPTGGASDLEWIWKAEVYP